MFSISQETFPTAKSSFPTPWETVPTTKLSWLSKKAVFRHCERSEAIQCTRMDCFTAFAMKAKRAI
jgi:hypothetical protein